ncbi:MAG: FAD binding domain-containing protein [Phycisphaerales bacterium]|nr:FAD binding domain-containing protein [Phycisphaerales bacterium]
MKRFALARPRSFEEASALQRGGDYALPVLKAAGMDVLDHLKEGLIAPDLLIDVRPLGRGEPAVERAGAGLRIHANATLAMIAASEEVAQMAPAVSQACASAATPQVRNVATAAGNLLQRPRCWYYRHAQFDCLKKGGHTCFAFDGENAYHAIFGDGPCHIVHPSNLALGLSVCDAVVHLVGGQRDSLALADLYHMPDKGIRNEHNLETGEVVTHLTLKAAPRSGFYAIKHKQSFDWPLVAAAAALVMDGPRITGARVTAGAVAPIPWPLPQVAEALAGVSVDDDDALRGACALASRGAKPLRDNEYKVKLLPVAVRRAVLIAAGRKAIS